MAVAAKKNDPAPAGEQGTSLALARGTAISADLAAELAADAGAGTSQATDDNILPFIVLLQDMSPEVKKRDPEYVDGAEVGMFLNKATKKLYAANPEDAEKSGLPSLFFQHCAFDRCVVEWIPRNDGGGFVARHDMKGSPEQTMKALGGRQVPDSQDPKKLVWKSADGKHDLVDTRYHFGNVVGADGSLSPAVLSFSSTGHTSSREWMSLMNNFKVQDGKGGLAIAPSWSKRYLVRSKPRKNVKGDFFVVAVDDGGIIADAAIRAEGKRLHALFKAGTVKADVDPGGSQESEGASVI